MNTAVDLDVHAYQLAKVGLKITFMGDHGFGYAGDSSLHEWTVAVEPIDSRRYYHPKFRPLVGLGTHSIFAAAVSRAVWDFEWKAENQEREIAVLALAGHEQ